jgi:fermentation-respiration switch protein FrsA (DUF1100 family)
MVMLRLLLIIGLGILLIYFYARYLEKNSLYFPMAVLEATPEQVGLEYEDIDFNSQNGIALHGWFIPKTNSKITVLFCHGNGGNISHRLDKILFFNKLGVSIFIFDYRGYGQSKGTPSEVGLYQDTQAAYDYLKFRQTQSEQIVVYGESLGGAAAVDLVSRKPASGLILEGTFSSVHDMVRHIYPILPPFLVKSKFDSLSKIKDVSIPKLFMHSRFDDIVPFKLGKKLFDAASSPKELLVLDGQHNDGFFASESAIRKTIAKFLAEL